MSQKMTGSITLNNTMTKPWIINKQDLSVPGLKVIQLNLSDEAREALNAHVPDLGCARRYAPISRASGGLWQRLRGLVKRVRRAMKEDLP
jgi:hypothetical protein